MNEKPKSVWKKTPNPLLAWLILFAGTFLAIFLIGSITGNIHAWQEWRRALLFTMFVAATVATVVVGLWLFIRWVFCWRNFKRFLFGFACFVTLIALFYAEEDWRGRHDWEQFKHQWEAKGEHFNFASFIPPPVPEKENFAFSPVWIAEEKYNFQNTPKKAEAWYGDRIYSEPVSKLFPLMPVYVSALTGTHWEFHYPSVPDVNGDWTIGRMTDLKPWQSYYRNLEATNPAADIAITPQPQSPAVDVLLALSKYNPVIEKLRTDSQLPDSRFPIQYDADDPAGILLPHLAALKQCAQVLQLRAIAELQNGESGNAFADMKLALRLADAVKTEPFIITHLVRIAILNLTLQPIYEGLAEHKWLDAQLAGLDAELAKLDFPADYEFSIRGERAMHVKLIDWMEQKRSRFWELFNMINNDEQKQAMNQFGLSAEIYLMPKGWYDQSKITMSAAQQQWLLPMVNSEQQTVSPQAARESINAVGSLRPSAVNLFARLLLPTLGNYSKKIAYGQTAANLARVAIALERYRLAHREYPASLDALTPQFMKVIPHDVIGGQPLHYRRTDDGQFVLYSVGWDETDDGGVVVLRKGNSPSVDISQGDWVWRYPAK